MGHYMTKDGVAIVCKNCLYWGNTATAFNGNMGSCGNANQGNRLMPYFRKCEHFWPKPEYRL